MPESFPTIKRVAEEIGAEIFGAETSTVTDVTHDSRQAKTGTLFVAIQGESVDGHRFIDDVFRKDAAGIISQLDPPVSFKGTWLKVPDARRALAKAAAFIHGNPSALLKLVGITGTNGKTTTTFLMRALAESAGEKSAMITTVEYRIGDESVPAIRTTPEASDTQRILKRASHIGCKMAVMEASSQAIDLRRCDFLEFEVAIFTNLTRDHLDYHGNMENYFAVKKELFDGSLGKAPRVSVINFDDKWGVRLASELESKGQKVVSYAQNSSADFTSSKIEVSLFSGTTFVLKTPVGERKITSPLIGKPHVYNMLSASAAAIELGYNLDQIEEALKSCVGAAGRFERVPHKHGFAVIVDYAHSDDALLNTLLTARGLTHGKIITVFGCGGDRDKSKRHPMGEVAGAHSDLVVITSDNPRTENPLKIIDEIETGVKKSGSSYHLIPDRREAIHKAISEAKQNDVVIIAGKGHETYQIVGDEKFHFDDREIAREAIDSLDL